MAEAGRYLLDVVGHEHSGRALRVGGQVRERRDQALSSAEVEPRHCLIEQEHLWMRHQAPCNEHSLLLPGRQGAIATVGKMIGSKPGEQLAGEFPVPLAVLVPAAVDERGVLAGDDDLHSRKPISNHPSRSGPDIPDTFAQHANVDLSVRLTQEAHRTAGGTEVGRGNLQHRGLPCAVRAQHRPAFVTVDAPINILDERPALAHHRNPLKAEDFRFVIDLWFVHKTVLLVGRHAGCGDGRPRLFSQRLLHPQEVS